MAIQMLKDGLNAIVDEVVDGFGLDDIIPMRKLEGGAPQRFPKNLDDKEFGGMKIQFSAYEHNGIRVTEGIGAAISEKYDQISKGNLNAGTSDVVDGVRNKISNTAPSIIDYFLGRNSKHPESNSIISYMGMTYQGSWQLFLPQSISANYAAGWNKTELSFLGNFLNSATKNVPSSLGGVARLANGELVNPQSELLFEGIDHRTFAYTFTLFPKNAEETELIRQLTLFFRANMTPAISPNTASLVLRYPNYFRINYIKDEGENPFLNKITLCVLENFDVGYKDVGSSFHRDGSPNCVVVSMRFREIEPVYRQMTEFGY